MGGYGFHHRFIVKTGDSNIEKVWFVSHFAKWPRKNWFEVIPTKTQFFTGCRTHFERQFFRPLEIINLKLRFSVVSLWFCRNCVPLDDYLISSVLMAYMPIGFFFFLQNNFSFFFAEFSFLILWWIEKRTTMITWLLSNKKRLTFTQFEVSKVFSNLICHYIFCLYVSIWCDCFSNISRYHFGFYLICLKST